MVDIRRTPCAAFLCRMFFLFYNILWDSRLQAAKQEDTRAMKKDIHPNYGPLKAHCVCGWEFETFSTAKEIQVTICSHCHPYFTGKQKFVDTAGRIEKFQKKFVAAADKGTNPYTRKPKAEAAKA